MHVSISSEASVLALSINKYHTTHSKIEFIFVYICVSKNRYLCVCVYEYIGINQLNKGTFFPIAYTNIREKLKLILSHRF